MEQKEPSPETVNAISKLFFPHKLPSPKVCYLAGHRGCPDRVATVAVEPEKSVKW